MVEAFKVRGLASVGANETIGPLLITTPYKVLQEFQDGAKEGVYLKREEAWMTAELEKIRGLENTDGYDELASAIYADSHAKTQARYDPKWGS
jgi:hypothetical protein